MLHQHTLPPHQHHNKTQVVYADIMCLDYDGNVIDAALIALVAALGDLKLPETRNVEGKTDVFLVPEVRRRNGERGSEKRNRVRDWKAAENNNNNNTKRGRERKRRSLQKKCWRHFVAIFAFHLVHL